MITTRSTYDQCVKEIDAAVREALEEAAFDGMEVSEGDIWADMATSYLMDAREDVAREVFRCQIGFFPEQLERIFAERRAMRAVKEAADRELRKQLRLRERREAEERARREATAATRAARCPKCFTVPAANGRCFC